MNDEPAGAGSGNTNICSASTATAADGIRRRGPAATPCAYDDVERRRGDGRQGRPPERPVDEEPGQRSQVVREVHLPERAAERGRDAGSGRLAAALATAVDPALVAPAVASAAPSLVTAACSARVRRRASVRSVRLARANGLLLSDGPGAGRAQRPLHGTREPVPR